MSSGKPLTILSPAIRATSRTGEFAAGGVIEGPNFHNVDLSGIRVRDPRWTHGDFTLADLLDFRCIGGDLKRGVWEGAALSESVFMDTSLAYGVFDHVLFQSAVLTACRLTYASFIDVDFSGSEFAYVIFDRSNMTRAVLHRVKAADASFRLANLDGADFRDANLKKADFRGASLVGTNFEGANLEGALFGELPEELRRLLL